MRLSPFSVFPTPLSTKKAPKGLPVNNPVRKHGVQNAALHLSRGILPAPSGKPVRRASAGGFIVHPRAAFRFAALARGYSCVAPSGLGELRIRN